MQVLDFSSAGELKDYVVDNSIPQASIVAITHKGGRWYLFFF